MKLHTLTKIRRATRQQDGSEGYLYLHQQPTGFQEMIFSTESLAQQFLDKLNEPSTVAAGSAITESRDAQPA